MGTYPLGNAFAIYLDQNLPLYAVLLIPLTSLLEIAFRSCKDPRPLPPLRV